MPIIILTSLGLLFGIVLSLIDKKEASLADEYLKRLPLYNCGSCGYAGCEGMSKAMLGDVKNYLKCKPLKGEKKENMEKYLKSIDKI